MLVGTLLPSFPIERCAAALACLAGLLASSVAAQDSSARGISLFCNYVVDGKSGWLAVEEDSRVLRWTRSEEECPRSATLELTISGPSCAAHLGNLVFVVAGTNTQLGGNLGEFVLVRLDRATNRIELLQKASSFPGVEPEELCHDSRANVLYVLDRHRERLLALPLDAKRPELPASNSPLRVAATKDRLPLLRRGSGARLRAGGNGGVMVIPMPTCLVTEEPTRFDVRSEGGGFVIEQVPPPKPAPKPKPKDSGG